jgi:hypothetical protein
MIPEQVDQQDMVALDKLIDRLCDRYTPEGVKYLAHKRLSGYHKDEWLAEQSIEGNIQSSLNSFPSTPLTSTDSSVFIQTDQEGTLPITKLLLHMDSINFIQLRDLTEYCILHQFTCTIKPTSWKKAFLVEIQKRQESLTEIKTVLEAKSLAEA